MTSRLISYSPLVLLSGCFGAHPTPPADPYQRSRILVLNQTAVMDTVTAVLNGQVVGLCNQQPLPASVQLASPGSTYREVATLDGRFRFFHIAAGTYRITATCPAYGSLTADTVRLGTGAASIIKIGLGCRLVSSHQGFYNYHDQIPASSSRTLSLHQQLGAALQCCLWSPRGSAL